MVRVAVRRRHLTQQPNGAAAIPNLSNTTGLQRKSRRRSTSQRELLPFVASGSPSHPLDFWRVRGTGDYAQDTALGRQFARAAIKHMQDHNDPTLLSSVIADMVRRGKVTGIEVGFADEIASHLMAPWAMR